MKTQMHSSETSQAVSVPKWPVLLIAVVFLLAPGLGDAHAQVALGLHGSYNLDAPSKDGLEKGAFGAGGQARFKVSTLPILINPGVETLFTGIDGARIFQFDANVLYPFEVDNSFFTPYSGLGLAVTRASYDLATVPGPVPAEKGTDVGLNLLGGATFGFGTIRPFVQARITLGKHLAYPNEGEKKGAGYAVLGGLLFHIGD
jgi:hypothetical protein